MTKEEIQDILEELHLVRPEILQPKAKKLFEAIMIIADERDKYKQMYEMEKALFIDADLKIERAIEYATNEMRIVNDNEYHKLLEILKGDKD